jgi:hypothetical protein
MFTIAHVAALVYMMAGGSWANADRATDRPSGGTRNGGKVRNGMRLWMHAAQGGLCPTCGNEVHPFIGSDLAHVVGSGDKRKGFLAGNIFLAHASCNVGQARLSFEYGLTGHGETRTEALVRVAQYCRETYGVTLANEAGYALVLTPGDFARPELVPMEWPTSTVGGFIYFDPEFQGKRKI